MAMVLCHEAARRHQQWIVGIRFSVGRSCGERPGRKQKYSCSSAGTVRWSSNAKCCSPLRTSFQVVESGTKDLKSQQCYYCCHGNYLYFWTLHTQTNKHNRLVPRDCGINFPSLGIPLGTTSAESGYRVAPDGPQSEGFASKERRFRTRGWINVLYSLHSIFFKSKTRQRQASAALNHDENQASRFALSLRTKVVSAMRGRTLVGGV